MPRGSLLTQPQSREGVPCRHHSYEEERWGGEVGTTQISLKQSIKEPPSLGDGKLEASDGISVLTLMN